MSSFTGRGSCRRAAAAAGLLAAVAAGCGEEPDGVEDVQSAIVGGTVATPHQFPWMAGLLQTGAILADCGASLVSPSWVGYQDVVTQNWFVKPDIAGAVISGAGAL